MVDTYRTPEPAAVPVAYSRIHWPSIVAGAFVTLALFVVSVALARAVDLDITFTNARSTGAETAAIIWGGISALICFGIGGWVAGMNATAAGRGLSWLNGFMVWAVAVPVLVFWLGTGVGPRLGQESRQGGLMAPAPNAVQASARLGGTESQPLATGSSNYVSHPQAAAWWMLASLALGLIGAAAMGVTGRKTTAEGYGHGHSTTHTPPHV
jgi:hypothetical protein